MRPSTGTPYFARVPQTQPGSPQAPQEHVAATSVAASDSRSSLFGEGPSNPAYRPIAELSMIAAVKRLPASTPAGRKAAATPGGIDNYYDAGNRFPNVVSLFSGTSSFCTGSLINSRTILTAAHCFAPNESISISFHAHREPQQSMRFGLPRNSPVLSARTEPFQCGSPPWRVC